LALIVLTTIHLGYYISNNGSLWLAAKRTTAGPFAQGHVISINNIGLYVYSGNITRLDVYSGRLLGYFWIVTKFRRVRPINELIRKFDMGQLIWKLECSL
jgi:hypothetical protein